jgi:hypothetical protein
LEPRKIESRKRTAPRNRTRSVNKSTAGKDPIAELLPNLAGFIDDGEITIGILKPVGCVATAADGNNCLAMLVRRDDETLTELLTRFDYAIGLALTEDIFTDEVNA